MLAFEFQVGELRNVWLIDSGCSRLMTGDKRWFSSLVPVVSRTYITFVDNGRGRVLSKGEIKVSDKVTLRRVEGPSPPPTMTNPEQSEASVEGEVASR
jgi:hypothetical protein